MNKLLTLGRRSSGGGRWRVAAVMVVAMAAFALAPTAAAIEGFEIRIPIDTVVRADEGSVTQLASEPVPEQYVGQSCAVSSVSANPDSVHPNNDLLVTSGDSGVTLPDVESESAGTVFAPGRLVLGSQIVVSLVMGPDGVFSAGMLVVVDCTAPPETTTTTTIPDEVLDTVVTPTTVPDEVLDTVVTTVPETLPFTGSESEELALIALALVGTGVLFLVATRSRRED